MRPTHHDVRAPSERRRAATALCLGGTGASGLWIGLDLGGHTVVRYADDLITLCAATAACLLAVAAWRRGGAAREFWLLLGAACASWTLAEAVWAVYDLGLGGVPSPSWADAGYLGAVPLAVAAFLRHPGIADGSPGRRWRGVLDGLTVAGAGLLLSWTVVLGPVARASDMSTLGGLVAVAYPVGDVVLLVLVVMTVRSMSGRSGAGLWAVLAGLVCMAVSDTVYAYLTEVRSYASGGVVDVGWIAAYLAIGAGAFLSEPVAPAGPAREPSAAGSNALGSASAPYLLLLPAMVAVAVSQLRHTAIGRGQWFLTCALLVLVLCRQWILATDRPTVSPGRR